MNIDITNVGNNLFPIKNGLDGLTKLHPSQPLNVIAEDGLDDPSSDNLIIGNNEEMKGEWSSCKDICDVCQIKRITGTCNQCGIYQYGIMKYDNQISFDIKVRRREYGISTEPTIIKSNT